MPHDKASYSEDALVEQPAIAVFHDLGWETANVYSEAFGPSGTLGRDNRGDVVLPARLRPALPRLDSALPKVR